MQDSRDEREVIDDALAYMTEEELRAIRAAVRRRANRLRPPGIVDEEQATVGQRLADAVTQVMGSWRFIIVQSLILIGWIVVNVIGWVQEWDPYPFILLNLALSFQAAYAAPIIMMSQNRQAAKDRLSEEYDFEIDVRAELEIDAIQRRLADLAGRQWDALLDVQAQQLALLERIEALTREVHRMASTDEPPDARAGED